VTYEDIGGLKEQIQRIREMVELPLRHPEIFQRLGIDPPKGVLLHGPPGCGKTLLAKAVANESDAYFISINGPEIMNKFYGESEARLREIFQQAQQNAPSIIFIDEIDAIAPKREEVTGEVERRVVAQLLALMDGLSERGNVIVIGATNRPNAIDPALRRPGRFDREIEIGIPDKQGRYEILVIHTRGMPLSEDVDLKRLAEITHGFTGADLAALCREAAMKALRRYLPEIDLEQERVPAEVLEKMEVKMEDFLNAFKEITPTALREVAIEVPTVHWDDIGDLEDVKQELKEAVEWPIKNPEMFKRMGIKPPKGILLFGPPGCGKTLLAKAVATESEANFISIKGPEVLSKWVGESERAIREVFRKARMSAPAVIFFDEIDSLVPRRGLGYGDSGVTERVISQLLTEIDGISTLEDVVVLAATNRPDLIDPAILRPGRFDRLVYVPSPNDEGRLAILKIHTKDMPLSKDVDLKVLASMTKGYSGADIEALCREAALIALRRDTNAKEVTMSDFQEAMKRVGPSITPDMENWYKSWSQQFKKIQRAAPPLIT
ncbi:MAG: CDC48 family AAA ATPase, partial [Candidatus Bathyarchaeia archaeon]